MPEVSIIIPCYNQAHYLGESIQSVLDQSFQDWECIIINDGSTDNTDEVASRYAIRDPRISLVSRVNGGLSSARNTGICIAKGRYLQFLDADDLLMSAKIEKQLDAIRSSGFPFVGCDYCHCEESSATIFRPRIYRKPWFETQDPLAEMASDWESFLSFPPHVPLFDAAFFREHHIMFDESLPNHEDWDCWMRILSLNKKTSFLNEVLVVYRTVSGSMSSKRWKMLSGFLKVIHKHQHLQANDKEMYSVLRKKEGEIIWRHLISLPLIKRFRSIWHFLKSNV